MANIAYVAQQLNDDELIIGVKSASDTLDDGNVVVANVLSTDDADGEDVYTATQVAAITDGNLAIVFGDEVFQDSNAARVPYIDPRQITYPSGRVVNAVRPRELVKMKFSNVTVDAATRGNIAVGQFIVPKASSYSWDVAADTSGNSTVALVIEKLIKIQVGVELVDGFLTRVVVGY